MAIRIIAMPGTVGDLRVDAYLFVVQPPIFPVGGDAAQSAPRTRLRVLLAAPPLATTATQQTVRLPFFSTPSGR